MRLSHDSNKKPKARPEPPERNSSASVGMTGRGAKSQICILHFALCTLIWFGCGYSTRSLLPSYLKTVAVVSVENSTTQPGLSEELNLALPRAFNADRNLRVTSPQQADLSLSVEITGYSRSAAAYDANQNIAAYEIMLTANFDAFDQVRDETFFSGTAISRVVYDPSSESEENVRQEAIEKLSKEIVRQVLTAW